MPALESLRTRGRIAAHRQPAQLRVMTVVNLVGTGFLAALAVVAILRGSAAAAVVFAGLAVLGGAVVLLALDGLRHPQPPDRAEPGR